MAWCAVRRSITGEPMATSLPGDLPEGLAGVKTRPLFVMRLNVRPLEIIGPAVGPVRRVGVVFGGVFNGERLSGEVRDGGNDWQTVRSDSAVTLDVRLVLKTDDEAIIGMAYRGIRHGSSDILARIDRGEAVDFGGLLFSHCGVLRDRGAEIRLAQSPHCSWDRPSHGRRADLQPVRAAMTRLLLMEICSPFTAGLRQVPRPGKPRRNHG